jgi:type III pantothenate kinase
MHSTKVFVLDGGNTHLKLGMFENHQLVQTKRFQDFASLEKHLSEGDTVVVANVGEHQLPKELKALGCQVFPITNMNPLPFINTYQTPKTLGIDRLCNVAAAHALHPKQNMLVVDVGTCIKFDFLNANGEYCGGSISPGIGLRYRSLNDYTANLPLLSPSNWQLVGSTTEASLHSGVMGSIAAEIKWRIEEYRNLYETLTVYLTGGDAHYFDMGQKNSIFVDENLTLKGIYALYLFQHP